MPKNNKRKSARFDLTKSALMGSELLLAGYSFGYVITPNLSESFLASLQIVGGGILAIFLVRFRLSIAELLLQLPIKGHAVILGALSLCAIFGSKLLSLLPSPLHGSQKK